MKTYGPLKLGSDTSAIGFETAAGGSWPARDRYLTLNGQRAYHIGNACNTCAFFFTRLEGANQSISPDEVAKQLEAGLAEIDETWVERVGRILPTGEYLLMLQEARLSLVDPGKRDDYFANEQVSLWGVDGFWGMPHHPRTEYYRGRTVGIAGRARLFEFVVPMFPHSWLKPEIVMSYQSRLAGDPLPTALAISVLDVKQPAVWEGEPDVTSHWCLAHYLLDGHHKVFAATQAGRKVGLLSFLAVRQGVSTVEQIEQTLDGSPRL